jgi:small subunit ribosomal protein S9
MGRPIDPAAETFRQSQMYDKYQKDGFRGPHASSAISLLHGDYSKLDHETNDDGDDPLSHGPGTGNPYTFSGTGGGQEEADAEGEPEAINSATEAGRQLLQMEQELRLEGERKAVQRMPVERHQQLDERGRAYGRGGRKTSSARVWIFKGEGNISVNDRDMQEYFARERLREQIVSPFVATKTCGMFDVIVKVNGGGLSGQAGAIRHGIARALQHYAPDEHRMPLKVLGYLWRDPRRVEPKKPGQPKARKKRQWVKR